MSEHLTIGKHELRRTTWMPGCDLIGLDGDLDAVGASDAAYGVDDVGGLGLAALAPDAGQFDVAGDDARIMVRLSGTEA